MSRPRIAIVSLGAANRASVRYGLERAGADVYFAERGSETIGADALVVPGVANIGHMIKALDARAFRAPMEKALASNVPILAICAGFQLLYEGSEEDPTARALGYLEGTVRRLKSPRTQHMGWNIVEACSDAMESGWAYFAHGFAAPAHGASVCARTTYGTAFAAAAQRGRVFGVQFHPERSGTFGAKVLARFVRSVGAAYAG